MKNIKLITIGIFLSLTSISAQEITIQDMNRYLEWCHKDSIAIDRLIEVKDIFVNGEYKNYITTYAEGAAVNNELRDYLFYDCPHEVWVHRKPTFEEFFKFVTICNK